MMLHICGIAPVPSPWFPLQRADTGQNRRGLASSDSAGEEEVLITEALQ